MHAMHATRPSNASTMSGARTTTWTLGELTGNVLQCYWRADVMSMLISHRSPCIIGCVTLYANRVSLHQ